MNPISFVLKKISKASYSIHWIRCVIIDWNKKLKHHHWYWKFRFQRRTNELKLILCPTPMTCNSRNVLPRMSCSSVVLAQVVGERPATKPRSTRPNQSQLMISVYSAGRNSRAVTFHPFRLVIWVFFLCLFFLGAGQQRTNVDVEPQLLRLYKAREYTGTVTHTHKCPLRLCLEIYGQRRSLSCLKIQLKTFP